MKAEELKQYIIDNDKADLILEDLGFHKLKDNGGYITCAIPNYNNSNGMSMLKENLFCNSFTTNFSFRGGIFDLISDIKGYSNFGDTMRYAHRILGLKYEYTPDKDESPKDTMMSFFKKYDKKHKDKQNKEVKTYDEEYIETVYDKCPYIGWIKEGVTPNIQEEFGIGYHYESRRVVIPHRYYKDGKVCGLIGRTLRNETEIELFGISKYYPIIKYSKSQNLYGLYENLKYIKEAGEVIIFEAEKSVLKMASRGVRNCVSVCCHDLSEEQIRMLIALDVNIVIAYDKDVKLDFIREECSKFKDMRNVDYIYDELGLLKEKESPADVHFKAWNVLYKRYKFKYKGEN